MSRSEITAWQLGVDIERDVRDGETADEKAARLDWQNLTSRQQEARFALGDVLFAYWVLRGADDAALETGR